MKLKRSTTAKHTYFGEPVFIYFDKEDGVVLVSYTSDWANEFPVSIADLKSLNQSRQGISAKPKQLTESEKSFKKELNVFFASQILETPKECENCGMPFLLTSNWSYRKITCHILPKSLFKEVAIHPQNRVFMCCDNGCYGHDKYDHGDALERSQMPVYKIAIERYQKLKESLTEAKIIKANKYLGL